MFKLEAVFAFEGDCLLLHYGPEDPHPNWLLIDGGARGTWRGFLEKRLLQLAEDWDLDGPVPLQMVMVSHVDADHVTGVLDLFKHLRDDRAPEKVCRVAQLWHNSFDDVIGNDDQELVSKLVAPPPGGSGADPDTAAVVASVAQGRQLRLDAEALGMATNHPFTGLVLAQKGPAVAIPVTPAAAGLTFRVLAPDIPRVREYQEKWNAFLREKGLAEVEAAAFKDESAFNLASLVVLAEYGGRKVLLTGDARGDFVVNGLAAAGLLDADAAFPERREGQSAAAFKAAQEAAEDREVTPFHVDLLKVPHHGSDRNVTVGFFRRVPADHYVISANGKHHNPDPPTLRMIAEARGEEDEYTIHFTFTEDQHETETNEEFAEALAQVHEWVTDERPDNCTVVYREPGEDVYSVTVDLSE
jgi:hypothetical protein